MNLFAYTQARIESALATVLDHLGDAGATDGPDGAHRVPARLLEAMRYAVLSPGKRLRPALVFGGARAAGLEPEAVLPAACAVEMVHAYSLVHDDLPSLDDDDLRRGQPTCHRAFDEATALLAGDALLTEALGLLAMPHPPVGGRDAKRSSPKRGSAARGALARPRARAAAVSELARAIGAAGMVGGQYDDVFPSATAADAGQDRAREALVSIHRRKTGRLIQASAALGALYGGASARDVARLRAFGAEVGLAFQLVDDALDGDGVARLDGAEAARARALEATERGVAHLDPLGRRARPLVALARAMVERRT